MTTTRRTPPPGERPVLRLREPADVLGAIPYILGYHPTLSVVLLALRGRDLYFSARHDLPQADAADEVGALTVRLAEVVAEHDVDGVLLVGYGPDERVRPLLISLRDRLEADGVSVQEALRADDGKYWSYVCDDPGCCYTGGMPFDPHSSPIAAEATYIGRVALPDRSAYTDQLKPVDGESRRAMAAATVRANERLVELLAHPPDESTLLVALRRAKRIAVDQAVRRQRNGERHGDDEVAWLSVLLLAIDFRELAGTILTSGPEVRAIYRGLWLDVFRRAEPDLICAPGVLFAIAATCCGEPTLAREALARVIEEDPTYPFARTLDRAIATGRSPSELSRFWALSGLLPQPAPRPARLRRRSTPRRRRRPTSRRTGSRPA